MFYKASSGGTRWQTRKTLDNRITNQQPTLNKQWHPQIPSVRTTAKPNLFSRFTDEDANRKFVKGPIKEPVSTTQTSTRETEPMANIEIVERPAFKPPVKPKPKKKPQQHHQRKIQHVKNGFGPDPPFVQTTLRPSYHRLYVKNVEDADDQKAFIHEYQRSVVAPFVWTTPKTYDREVDFVDKGNELHDPRFISEINERKGDVFTRTKGESYEPRDKHYTRKDSVVEDEY